MKTVFAFFLMIGMVQTALAKEAEETRFKNNIQMVEAKIGGTGFELNGLLVISNPRLQVADVSRSLVAHTLEKIEEAAIVVCYSLGRPMVDFAVDTTKMKAVVMVSGNGGVNVFNNNQAETFIRLRSVTCK